MKHLILALGLSVPIAGCGGPPVPAPTASGPAAVSLPVSWNVTLIAITGPNVCSRHHANIRTSVNRPMVVERSGDVVSFAYDVDLDDRIELKG